MNVFRLTWATLCSLLRQIWVVHQVISRQRYQSLKLQPILLFPAVKIIVDVMGGVVEVNKIVWG